jgi:uncharacterized coiled-coil protein SlyX
MSDDHPVSGVPSPAGSCQILSLTEHRLRELEVAVLRTEAKLDKLQRKLIRGEVRKGKLRRKLHRRIQDLDAFRQRVSASPQSHQSP